MKTKKLVVSAVVAALYAGMTLALAPISYGAIQLRISEAFCVLPFLIPETALGLFAGCILANLLTGNIFDVIFGSLATLLAGLSTAWIGKKAPANSGLCTARLIALLPPVLFNGLIIGAVLAKAYGIGHFWLCAGQIALSEALVVYIIGLPLLLFLSKKENLYK